MSPVPHDEAPRLLVRRGFDLPREHVERDWRQPYGRRHARPMSAWMAVYRDPKAHWELYELAEKLVDYGG
ncbi:MAG: hypothetical protein IPN17_36065 [Deltaproteobacteria bacterium]|nr:hypothetical protein [Deltaproteobacteria bacterium]